MSENAESIFGNASPKAPTPQDLFREEGKKRVRQYPGTPMATVAKAFMEESILPKYSYNFTWLGRPIIQYPQDMVAVQEIVFSVKPDLIIETGIAHGGSLIFSASLLELNCICGGPADAEVLGIDIDIREHNREAIQSHPLSRRIRMIEGSSIDPVIVSKAKQFAANKSKILVLLDSNHTFAHVLSELQAYAPLVSIGSYCVVFDTIVADLPKSKFMDRPWGPEDNPKRAVHEFLATHPEFQIDTHLNAKLLISVCPDGYLQRIL